MLKFWKSVVNSITSISNFISKNQVPTFDIRPANHFFVFEINRFKGLRWTWTGSPKFQPVFKTSFKFSLRRPTSGLARETSPNCSSLSAKTVTTQPQSIVHIRNIYQSVAVLVLHRMMPFSAPSDILFWTIPKRHLVFEGSTACLPKFIVRSTVTIFDPQKGHHTIPCARSYRMLPVPW